MWNTLFLRADTVAEAVAAHYGITKAQLLDRDATDLPVRMALGEAQVGPRLLLLSHCCCYPPAGPAASRSQPGACLAAALPRAPQPLARPRPLAPPPAPTLPPRLSRPCRSSPRPSRLWATPAWT